ncbi:hypothetical protein PsYK624_026740 [Phanerochaete sordida]|uniref:Uncharacterized protein n=1 Tax=Phanerochaete sordida TaxID=48140 RepID=A0A9P3G2B8_9APHY|nr:hypothetical protein PsYK624_026740 [Phanerochaete sordida]
MSSSSSNFRPSARTSDLGGGQSAGSRSMGSVHAVHAGILRAEARAGMNIGKGPPDTSAHNAAGTSASPAVSTTNCLDCDGSPGLPGI